MLTLKQSLEKLADKLQSVETDSESIHETVIVADGITALLAHWQLHRGIRNLGPILRKLRDGEKLSSRETRLVVRFFASGSWLGARYIYGAYRGANQVLEAREKLTAIKMAEAARVASVMKPGGSVEDFVKSVKTMSPQELRDLRDQFKADIAKLFPQGTGNVSFPPDPPKAA